MLDLTAIKARRNLLPPGQFIATLGSGEHVCTAIYAEQDDGTLSFVADFWPDYELKLTPVRHAMSTMKAFMAYPADIDSLIAEVERLQLIEKAAEQLDVLREINDYIGHYGEQFVLTGNPKDLK